MTTRSPSASTSLRLEPRASARRRDRLLAVPAWVAVVLLVGLSAGARALAGTGVAAPWIAPDEPLYGLVGRTLIGEPTVLGDAVPHVSLLTPALLGLPGLLTDDVAHALAGAQVLQAVVMSSAAAVAFAWARPLAGERWAFAAALLTVAVPGLAYAGLMMTEALFYPVSALALWSLARLATQPTLARHALFLIAACLAVATRYQALALVPAAAVALTVAGVVARRRDLGRAAVPYAALSTIGLVSLAALVASGRSPLGAYTVSVSGGYEAGAVARDVAWHAGALVLLSTGIPLVALGALLPALRRRLAPPPALVALVAVTSTWAVVLVLQVGTFASQFVGHLAERDLLSALPPLFVCLAAWCRQGGATRVWTAAVALAVAAPAVALPIGRLATNEAMLDGFSTIALRKLAEHSSTRTLEVVWPLAVVVIVAVPVLCTSHLRRRAGAVAVTAVALVVLASIAQSDVRRASAADARWWFGDASPRWIDESADGPVTWIQAGTRYWGGAWKTAFWNRRVVRIVRFAGTGRPGPVDAPLVTPRADGRLLGADGRALTGPYVAAPVDLVLDGEQVARLGPSGDQAGIALWRVEGTTRLLERRRGLEPNGDLRGTAVLDLWDCRGGHVEVTLLGKEPTLVAFDVSGGSRTSVPIGPNQVKVATVDVPDSAGRCRVSIGSRALVGVTQIARTR